MGMFDDYFAQLPETSFNEIRRMREQTTDPKAQERLSMEDRRAFAREQVNEKGLSGAAQMAVMIPAEQAAKAALSIPVLGPMAQQLLGVSTGRSGFHNPLTAVSAGYSGILQGLNDRGMFGASK